ncbi:hypothetical protein N781_12540 [Pontibacillus halophilus JSM 076056 = DSM 19796]|uniref:General stress protein n=1 Tax=Pontibacillus halophilus JSM 076056 = DSM 19796 TaxID=1385510 RepID=A0A0A5GIZ7_9BACI|nr:YtxH domain-containing protein [Pontibacillus halophilus]KGX93231.1 hypothetical protein N781_12540 [Pontibacillus halophilus JSM 076056 = DSM 19796]
MQQQTNRETKSNSKLVRGMLIGAAVGGAVALLDRPTRTKVQERSNRAKETVGQFAKEVKEDPQGMKDELVNRVQGATETVKEAVEDFQTVYEKTTGEIAEKVNDVEQDSKEALSATKGIGEDLQEAGQKLKDAKEELTQSDEGETNGNQPVAKTTSIQER